MDAIEKRARNLLGQQVGQLEVGGVVNALGDLFIPEPAVVKAVIAALTPPEGYVLFPVEPTVELLSAMSKALGIEPLPSSDEGGGYPITGSASTVRQCYDALIAARPEVP